MSPSGAKIKMSGKSSTGGVGVLAQAAALAKRGQEEEGDGENGQGGLIADCIKDLIKERGDNQTFPDEDERGRILRWLLEFACCEMAPGLFEGVIQEIGEDAGSLLENNPFTRAYTVFDAISTTEGDGSKLEMVKDDFVTFLVNYEEAAEGRSNELLNEYKAVLHTELKAQICLGSLVEVPRTSPKPSVEKLNVKALEAAIDAQFPEPKEQQTAVDIAASKSPAALTMEIMAREDFHNLAEIIKAAKGKKKGDEIYKKAESATEALLVKHDWEKFLDALRLFVSVLLYTVYDGPKLLNQLRAPPPPSSRGHMVGQPRKSRHLELLHQVFKSAGNMIEWNRIVSKNEQEGQDILKHILDKAQQTKAARADGDPETDDARAPYHMADQEIYGDEAEDFVDDALMRKAARPPMISRDRFKDPHLQQEIAASPSRKRGPGGEDLSKPTVEDYYDLTHFDRGGGSAPRMKKRKKPVPWTEEESACLQKGVAEYGIGSWAKILSVYEEIFAPQERTSVSLKDRYRNMEMQRKRNGSKDK